MIVNIVCDAFVCLIIVFFIIRGYNVGLIKTAFRPKRIYSFILAYEFYQKLSDKVRERFIYPFVKGRIDGLVKGAIQGDDVSSEALSSSVPDFVRRVARVCNIDIDTIADTAAKSTENALSDFIDSLASHTSVFVSAVISFIIIYFSSIFLLKIAEAVLNGIFKAKILKPVNKTGGLIFGIIAAFFFALIASYCLGYGVEALAKNTDIAVLSTFDAERTILIRWFLKLNPLRWFI